MSKKNKNRNKTEASDFLAKGSEESQEAVDVSEDESEKDSADKAASEPKLEEAEAKVEEVKAEEVKAEKPDLSKLPRKFHKFL